ncbi:MAG: helix-turn-helix domain-containing protein [Oscillospiraceae bacterium]|nr:helix-turn-helix domain-containing protein [Oscillospiraceae bacterium]
MQALAKNIRQFRLQQNLTQEELALPLGVTAQAVSRWERGECCPDISLLPGLAGLFACTVDQLLGVDELRSRARLNEVFMQEQQLARQGKYAQAAQVLEHALTLWPGELGLMSELAMVLALQGELTRAIALCEQVLAQSTSVKLCGTTRAALCFIYHMNGQPERARELAKTLPHARESREEVLRALQGDAQHVLQNIYLGE